MSLLFLAHSAPRNDSAPQPAVLDVLDDLQSYVEFADLFADPSLAEAVAQRLVEEQERLIDTHGFAAVVDALQSWLEVDVSDFDEEEYLEFIEHFVLDCFEAPEDDFDEHVRAAHGAVLIGRADDSSGGLLHGDDIAAVVKSVCLANSVAIAPCSELDHEFDGLDHHLEAYFGNPTLPVDVSDESRRVYEYRDDDLEVYTIIVDQPKTCVVGEEGEHIFGLKNRATLIVPGNFVDYSVYWGVPA